MQNRQEMIEVFDQNLDFLKGQEIVKVLYTNTDFEYLQSIDRDLKDITYDMDVSYSSNRYIEFNHKGVNKGAGLKKLANLLHIDIQDTIAIGDNYNDLPMLAEVGHPWIMKNSALDQAGFGQSHQFLRAESVEEILKKL